MSAAGVNDDAGAFPGFNEAFARVRAVELHDEVVHVGGQLHERGGVGFHFAQQGDRYHTEGARGDEAKREFLIEL